MKHNRWKSYEMMSCYQGLLEYCEIVKKVGENSSTHQLETPTKLLQAAIMTAEDIVKEEINLAGGCACSEAWFHGARKQHLLYLRLQETCVTTTWMRFCDYASTGNTWRRDDYYRTWFPVEYGPNE